MENLRLLLRPDILEEVADAKPQPEMKGQNKAAEATLPAPAAQSKESIPGSPAQPAPAPSRPTQALTAGFRKFIPRKGNIWVELPELFSSLFSFDPPTRRMAVLFFLSLFGLISVLGIAIRHYWSAKRAVAFKQSQVVAKRLEEFVRKESEEANRRASVINLGTFSLELKASPQRMPQNGRISMAEIEIVLLCDGKDTRDYIEDNMVKVRNQLTNLFTGVDRDELMSREGKKKIKKNIMRRLNEWLIHGKIEDIYISKLIMS